MLLIGDPSPGRGVTVGKYETGYISCFDAMHWRRLEPGEKVILENT